MKTKYITFTLLLLAGFNLPQLSKAQESKQLVEEIVIPLSQPGERGSLEVKQIYGSIKVSGYNGKEVIVIAKQQKLKTTMKKKNGLRRVQNNTMSLEVEESDNYVKVDSHSYGNNNKPTIHLEIKVPKNFNLKLKNINDGSTWVENVNGEMEISNINNDIHLQSISGSAVVDSVNGSIKATFDQVNPDNDMAFTSFNENVDITLPKDVRADIKARTENGEIFTGFDIEFDTSNPVVKKDSSKNSYKVKIEKWVTGKANGGGAQITLKSHSGDIIIRAAE